MSSPNLARGNGGPTQKQRLNVYTMMLILSFVAIVIGCILLAVELAAYGPEWPPWNTSSAVPSVSSLDQAPLAPALTG